MSKLAFVAFFTAALAADAHAQPSTPVQPAPAPVPSPPPPPPPVEEAAPAPDAQADEVGGSPDPGADLDPGEALEPDEGKGKKPKKDKTKGAPATDAAAEDAAANEPPPIVISGRVFVRATAFDDENNPWIGGIAVDSARVQVNYAWKKRLAAEVSFEVRGSIRDAYLDIKLNDCWELRAGRFKQPASAIERTSTWSLPTIDRPIVATILDAGLAVTGRRGGAQLTWRYKAGLHPRLEVALAQSMDVEGQELPRNLEDYAGLMASARFEIRPVADPQGNDVRLGVFAQNREVNHSTGIGRYWAGGLDLEVDLPGLGLRVWGDAIAGTGHFGAVALRDDDTPFVAGQLVAGWRRGGADRGKRFIEPFVSAAYFNPTTEQKRDQLSEFKVGVAGGRWKRWRGQVQFALQSVGAERPSHLGGINVPTFDDRTTVSAQLGAAF